MAHPEAPMENSTTIIVECVKGWERDQKDECVLDATSLTLLLAIDLGFTQK